MFETSATSFLLSSLSSLSAMPSSLLTQATRAFVKVLLTLAQVYELALNVNRDSSEKDLLKAYKRVALKAHPDKGGTDKDFKTLQAAREEWEALRTTRSERPAGRRWGHAGAEATVASEVGSGSAPKSYRVRGCSVLLTYHGFSDLTSWKKSFWTLSKRPWRSGALSTGAPRWNEVLQGSCTPTWFYSSAPQSTGQLATSRSRAALRTPALTTYSTKACAAKKFSSQSTEAFSTFGRTRKGPRGTSRANLA